MDRNKLGSLIQLYATSEIDDVLYDKQNSYFLNQQHFKRHIPFSIINENLNIPNISFNNTCTIKIPIKGTVIYTSYLRIILPSIEEYNLVYYEDVEYRLIKELKLYAKNVLVQRVTGNFMKIYSMMFGEYKRTLNKFLIKDGNQRELYIPLWFGADKGQFFPISGLEDGDVSVVISFADIENLVTTIEDPLLSRKIKLNVKYNRISLSLHKLIPVNLELKGSLFVEYCLLHKNEQLNYIQNTLNFVYEYISQYEIPRIDLIDFQNVKINNLPFTFPVKYLVILRKDIHDEFNLLKIDDIRFFRGSIEYQPNINADKYKILNHFYFSKNVTHNNIYLFTFALNTNFTQPNGIGNISNNKLNITLSFTDLIKSTVEIIAVGYNVLEIENKLPQLKLL